MFLLTERLIACLDAKLNLMIFAAVKENFQSYHDLMCSFVRERLQ